MNNQNPESKILEETVNKLIDDVIQMNLKELEKKLDDRIVELSNSDVSMSVFGRDFMLTIREIEKNFSRTPRPLTQQQIDDFGLERNRPVPKKPSFHEMYETLSKIHDLLNTVTRSSDPKDIALELISLISSSNNIVYTQKFFNLIREKTFADPYLFTIYAEIWNVLFKIPEFKERLEVIIHRFLSDDKENRRSIDGMIFIGYLYLNGTLPSDVITTCSKFFKSALPRMVNGKVRRKIDDVAIQRGIKFFETVGFENKPAFMNKWLKHLKEAVPFCAKEKTREIIRNLFGLKDDEKVILKSSPNAWKPERQRVQKEEISEEEAMIKKTCCNIRFLLNRITTSTLPLFTTEFLSYDVSSNRSLLEKIIDLIVKKSSEDPIYSKLYAMICRQLIDNQREINNRNYSVFGDSLLNRCKTFVDNVEGANEIVFIGHFYLNELIPIKVIKSFISQFISSNPQCGIQILMIIGPVIDRLDPVFLDDCLGKLGGATGKSRFLMMNLIDLRKNSWILKKDSLIELKMKRVEKGKKKLPSSPNAWKPERQRKNEKISREEAMIRTTCRQVRFLLNQVTESTLKKFTKQFISFNVSSNEKQLTQVVQIVLDKAVDEPMYRSLYVKLCVAQVIHEFRLNNGKSVFKDTILMRAETFFMYKRDIEEKQKFRIFGLNIFIGHLYLNQLIPTKTVQNHILELFGSIQPKFIDDKEQPLKKEDIDEESVHCGLQLIETVGQMLDKAKEMTPVFLDERMKELNMAKPLFTNKLRFKIMDLEELRKEKWLPKRSCHSPIEIEKKDIEVARQNDKKPRKRGGRPKKGAEKK